MRRLHVHDPTPFDFWQLVDFLLNERTTIPQSSPSVRCSDAELFQAIEREVGLEVGRDNKARGLLYVGVRDRSGESAFASALKTFQGVARVSLLSRRPAGNIAKPEEVNPLVHRVFLDTDEELAVHDFVLYLSEQSAYGLIQRAGGATFHTCDAPLVDALVAKLQSRYDLQVS